jgi:hypothetical protein
MNSILSLYHPVEVPFHVVTPITATTGRKVYQGLWSKSGKTYTSMVVYDVPGFTYTFTLLEPTTVYLLMLGGGGGGGHSQKGVAEPSPGGGAGGAVYGTISLAAITYTIDVGEAGVGGTAPSYNSNNARTSSGIAPTNGGRTTFSGTTLTALGGGRAGFHNPDAGGNAAGINANKTNQSGANGGCGGGSLNAYASTITPVIAGTGSGSSSSGNLLRRGFNGGLGIHNGSSGGGGGCASAGSGGSSTNTAKASVGGSGLLFDVSGNRNDYINKYYGVGGCGGSANGLTLDQSSITSVGGVIGGTSEKPRPDDAITFGSGGSGAYSHFGNVAANGANGKSGIVIILVP